jgi:hypothetical protein
VTCDGLLFLAVCVVTVYVEPAVAGEGKDAVQGLATEFGCVLSGVSGVSVVT